MPSLSEIEPSQPRAVATLRAALASGRLHHAYLVVARRPGPARDFVSAVTRSLVCAEADRCGPEALCPSCRRVEAGSHPDVQRVLPNDKGNIPVDVVRATAARLSLRSATGGTKVVVFEQADCMLGPAQNALLKTLEEPPGATCLLLTTTQPRELLPTIRSRCQRINLAPGRWGSEARARLEAAGIPPAVSAVSAALAGDDRDAAQALVDGGIADILEQLRAANLVQPRSDHALCELAAELASDRDRGELALQVLTVAVRDALALRHECSADLVWDPDLADRLALATTPGLGAMADLLTELRRNLGYHPNGVLALERLFFALPRPAVELPRPAR